MKIDIENSIMWYIEQKISTIIAEKGENACYDGGELLWFDFKSVTNREIEDFKRSLINVIRKTIEQKQSTIPRILYGKLHRVRLAVNNSVKTDCRLER